MNIQVHTRPKIFIILRRDNKNCSSVAAYYNGFEVISMNFSGSCTVYLKC